MRALLLDFGGVIHRSALELLPAWAARSGVPAEGAARSGPFGGTVDPLWHSMQRGELSEREFWSRRAAEFGAMFGQDWSTADLLLRVSDVPENELVRPELLPLLEAADAAGVPSGVLSNDLEYFHGPEWVTQQEILRRFDAIVDGSVTGLLKPEPAAYRAAATALGVDFADIIFLDDQPWNVTGAEHLGAQAIHVDVTDPEPAFRAAAEALQHPAKGASHRLLD